MDKEIFLILQKFSIETIVFGGIICLICFFINKYANNSVKKFSLYYPYVLGILFYFIYTLIIPQGEMQKVFSMGITTGGVATIMLSFIKTQKDKTTLAEEVLRGIVSEKDIKIVKEKISKCNSLQEIADIITDYSVFAMTYDQCMIFAEILDYFRQNDTTE